MYKILRERKHKKIRKKIIGTGKVPRLSVFRSGKHIYVQLIDDGLGITLIATSDLKEAKGTKKEKAYEIGKKIAMVALKKKINKVIFDRGGFLYHGRISEVARGAREGGLIF